jgi:hypothetical protein
MVGKMRAEFPGLQGPCSLHALENKWFDTDTEMTDSEANICSYFYTAKCTCYSCRCTSSLVLPPIKYACYTTALSHSLALCFTNIVQARTPSRSNRLQLPALDPKTKALTAVGRLQQWWFAMSLPHLQMRWSRICCCFAAKVG